MTMAEPSLSAGDARCVLHPGVHALGGRASDALELPVLESQPRAAILTVGDDGSVSLQRTSAAIMVRLDGQTLGIAPVALRDGARIEFAECRLVFGAGIATAVLSNDRASAPLAAATGESARAPVMNAPSDRWRVHAGQARPAPRSTSLPDAVLVDARSGTRYPLPARRIHIGRDETCDVVVRGNGASRRHASVAPVAGGFMLRDESTNGTMVNGVRVVGTYLLGDGDVVRLHDEELRVEIAASPAPVRSLNGGGDATAVLDLSHITRGLTGEQDRAAPTGVLLASLEIVRGQFSGACFQIERAVCSIGRGDDNDVRIRDATVSTAHATLLRKGRAWFVVDLRSMNGTYVDGSRVAGERELYAGSNLRIGSVELVFRATEGEVPTPAAPRRSGIRTRLRELLRSVAPPASR
jgi:pSer/pThr/pTyr-binding forkhead associated (FHA) protein